MAPLPGRLRAGSPPTRRIAAGELDVVTDDVKRRTGHDAVSVQSFPRVAPTGSQGRRRGHRFMSRLPLFLSEVVPGLRTTRLCARVVYARSEALSWLESANSAA